MENSVCPFKRLQLILNLPTQRVFVAPVEVQTTYTRSLARARYGKFDIFPVVDGLGRLSAHVSTTENRFLPEMHCLDQYATEKLFGHNHQLRHSGTSSPTKVFFR